MSRIWKFGRDVDTDQIVPGRFAPYMRPDADVGTAAFIEAHPEFNQLVEPGDLLVAEENFGCGSSREYAPQALRNRGIGAIIAKSFAPKPGMPMNAVRTTIARQSMMTWLTPTSSSVRAAGR